MTIVIMDKLTRDVSVVTADLVAADQSVLKSAVQGADAVLSALGPRSTSETAVVSPGHPGDRRGDESSRRPTHHPHQRSPDLHRSPADQDPPVMTAHPSVAVTNPDAQAAVDAFVAGLQAGHDRVTTPPTADPDRPFSEMAMYVLVRRGDQWWLAAGQNTPMRPGGGVPATA